MRMLVTLCALAATSLSGCTLDPFSQKRVRFSNHDAPGAGGVTNLSYPSTLRAATLIYSIDSSIPSDVLAKATDLDKKRISAEDSLKTCRLISQSSARPPKRHNCSNQEDELADIKSQLELTLSRWRRILILAEPPPDVTSSANIKLDLAGGLDETSALQLGLGLGENVSQTQLSTESDTKRHLAYRINEALINYPSLIGPHYVELMLELIKHRPAVAGNDDSKAGPTTDEDEAKGLPIIGSTTDGLPRTVLAGLDLDQLGLSNVIARVNAINPDIAQVLSSLGLDALVSKAKVVLRSGPGITAGKEGVLQKGAGLKLRPDAGSDPYFIAVSVPQENGKEPLVGWVRKSEVVR